MEKKVYISLIILLNLIIELSTSDLTVISPRFRNHVRSKTEVIMGDILKLNCAAVGKPTTHVHWYRNNQLIMQSKDQSRNERIKANRSFLKINKVEPGDEGEYACHVWNQAGQIWRNFSVSIVDLPPQRRYPAKDLAHNYSQDRKQLEAWLEGSDSILSKSKDVSDENTYKDYIKKQFEDLSNLPMSDGQTYQSNFTSNNGKNFVDNNAYYIAPYWTKPESDLLQTVATPAGRQVKLTCRANGKPEPQVIWFKDGKNITADTERLVGLRYQIKKWALILEDVVPSDKGVYSCMAFNKYGNITHNYTLEVVERFPVRPIIAPEYPKNLTVFVGDNATFECPVLSDLQPHIEWVKHCTINGSYEDEEGAPCLEKVTSDVPDNWDGEQLPSPMLLIVNNVTLNEEGWYTCIAGNQIGFSHRSAWLSVLQRNDSISLPRNLPTDHLSYFMAMSILGLLTVLLAFCISFRWAYVKTRRKNVIYDNENAGQNSPFTSMKKIVKVYRNDSILNDQNLVPKITVTPRYQSSRFSQELNIHKDYEFPFDRQWEIAREDITLIKSCGQGAFGQVYMSEFRMKREGGDYEHVTVAVKMLKDNATERELIDLFKELEVMKQICQPPRHPNIINLIGCCSQDGPLYVIVEYCAYGNLLTFLRDLRPQQPSSANYEEPNSKRDSKKVLTTQDLVHYALQVARGMTYLSEKKCIHRDLAARNVLVSEEYVLKIGDFGFARDITEDEYYRKNSDGRLPIKWMAPECLFDRKYTVKSDVWSYGVLLWEIMTLGGKPYPSIPFENLGQFLKDGGRMCQPHNCPNEIYALMNVCWRYRPEDRWYFHEIATLLDNLLSNTEEYVEVIGDDFASNYDEEEEECSETAPAFDGTESLKDAVSSHYEENEEEQHNDQCPETGFDRQDSEIEDQVELEYVGVAEPLLASVHRRPKRLTTDGAGGGVNGLIYSNQKINNPVTSPLRTTLRPISETSELFDMGTDDDDDRSSSSNYRKSRPSATDSGNPSSPGCSFEGSSDSMDSKYSLSGPNSNVFDEQRLKRRSDPMDSVSSPRDEPPIDDCRWPVPKQLPKRERAASAHITNCYNVLL